MKNIKFLSIIFLLLILTACSNNSESIDTISIETKNKIKDYLQENISKLSPQKETLGGKFYITKLSFQNPDLISIDYEDGHIALQAKANFKIENDNLKIINFELINKEDTLITNEYLKCAHHDDCIPLPACHPHECINKKFQDNYNQPEICTTLYDNCAAYENNNCICQQGTCFNENLMNQECNQ
jgi:hypothetical protein